jgi:class 3 adenylate cyclase
LGVVVSELPSGTVTFLFTDLAGSTRLWDDDPEAMSNALARHDEILRSVITSHGGHVVKTTGDGAHAAFSTAHDALAASAEAQRLLAAGPWDGTGPLKVRMGLHTCEAELRDSDYYGSAVNRAARLMSVAHGGQVVVSLATSELVRDADWEFVDLGEHRLADLARTERVFQLIVPDMPSEFPPLRSLEAFSGNLPLQLTSFVGREDQLVVLTKLLGASRLVTLTGMGGVGKTRLALQIAAEIIGQFPDGAWWCEFAPVTDPAMVWETLATSLRVQPSPGRAVDESVLDYLTAKQLLLVLDNCEHLLDPVARLVDTIEHRCPKVSVLATSREGLAVAGEQLVAVPPLGVPAEDADDDDLHQAEAVCLFWDRASAARSDFALTDRNVGAVGVLSRWRDAALASVHATPCKPHCVARRRRPATGSCTQASFENVPSLFA